MREGDTFATRFLYGVIIVCVFLTGIFAMLSVGPQKIDAAGMSSDAQCLPYAIPPCACGTKMGAKGCEPDPANKFGCPCMDVTNGFPTPGTCIATFKCQASGGSGMPPMPPMIPPPMPSPPSDPCSGGGTGTSNASSSDWSGGVRTGSSTAASSTCPGGSGSFPDYSQTFPSFDSSSFNNFTTGQTDSSGVTSDIISSLLSGNQNSNTDGFANNNTGGAKSGGTTAGVKPLFGSAEGASGDIQVQGNSVTLLVSNRDSTRGTQVSGQYGFSIASGVTALNVFKAMCASRPWAANFLSFIIPSTYFDSLCTARGLTVGVKLGTSAAAGQTSSGSSGTSQTSTLGQYGGGIGISILPGSGTNAPPPPPPVPIGPLRADIWATPPSVVSGQRTSIFWNATGVLSCAVTSSDNTFSGSALSGHGSSQPITHNTTFSIACQSATSSVSNQVVVTVQ